MKPTTAAPAAVEKKCASYRIAISHSHPLNANTYSVLSVCVCVSVSKRALVYLVTYPF